VDISAYLELFGSSEIGLSRVLSRVFLRNYFKHQSIEHSVGEIFSGCNVENASYGLTLCAERTTVCTAVAAGIRTFTQMVIVADSETPCPPCGACRQFLFEFAPNLELWVANISGETKFYRLCDLLPEAFGPAFIQPPKPKASELF
jgi:cytidine deaminase